MAGFIEIVGYPTFHRIWGWRMSIINRILMVIVFIVGVILLDYAFYGGIYTSHEHESTNSKAVQSLKKEKDRRNTQNYNRVELGKDSSAKEKEQLKEKEKILLAEKKNLEAQVAKLESEKKLLIETIKKQKAQLESIKNKRLSSRGNSSNVSSFYVTATAYTADCEGCSGITATGVDVRYSTTKIIAVDPNVIPLGSKVEIIADGKSMGYYSAEDKGGAIKGYRIDILMGSRSEALAFGRKKVLIRVLNKK